MPSKARTLVKVDFRTEAWSVLDGSFLRSLIDKALACAEYAGWGGTYNDKSFRDKKMRLICYQITMERLWKDCEKTNSVKLRLHWSRSRKRVACQSRDYHETLRKPKWNLRHFTIFKLLYDSCLTVSLTSRFWVTLQLHQSRNSVSCTKKSRSTLHHVHYVMNKLCCEYCPNFETSHIKYSC